LLRLLSIIERENWERNWDGGWNIVGKKHWYEVWMTVELNIGLCIPSQNITTPNIKIIVQL